ncbi:unnamed protein product [Spirodela intermedia]|uniref:Uncharacterized protein n=2 Tax=Spirodela intermedia TaxID=51605 RepID=A0A7I8KHX4_SPIIN|nr:unnamed protein product [Spirodela intermedia]CAA6660264.1 unnamed protein product [Spirodela intermedia]CAA7396595.1 unnamed protein product [Spirodela intermedia]
MLENAAENVRRYAPPSNRALGRRKSGDRFEKVNYASGHDGKKNQSHSRNFLSIDHGELINSKYQSENPYSLAIPVDGCCNSEAAQLLSERWAAAMQSCNDPAVDLSDRPVMYAGAGGPAWGQLNLPHQMDFLAELRRAYHSSLSSTPSCGR